MDDYEDRPAISYESMYRALQKEVKQQKDMYKGVKYALDTSEKELADLNKAYDNLQDCHLQVCNEHEALKQLVGELKNHYPDDGKLAGVQYPEVIYRLLQAIKED